MTSEERIEALLKRVEELERRAQRHEDIQAVRTLQFKYGYYMDKCLFAEIVDLFSEQAELRFMGGVFHGKEGARRLYGGSSGLNGPVDGMLFEHLIVQDIVDISPDGRTAYGRFRTFMQGGVHETKKDAPPQIPGQFWEGGIYENEYVKEGGVWKIARLHFYVTGFTDYDLGWTKSAIPLAGPSAAIPPDKPPTEVYRGFPGAYIPPYHYAHPVTGEPLNIPEPADTLLGRK